MPHRSEEDAGAGTAGWSRALSPSPWFWSAMLCASALGANLGDLCADSQAAGLKGSTIPLALASLALMFADRRAELRSELFYWLAVVVLRALATNVGDLLTDDLHLGRAASSVVFAVATLAAGYWTSSGRSPRIDSRYWLAMALGGVFGTVFGDLVSHAVGLLAATLGLVALVVVAIAVRARVAPMAALGYWAIVLAERAAGTTAGDGVAKPRGLGLGLIDSMAIFAVLLVVALAFRARFDLFMGPRGWARSKER